MLMIFSGDIIPRTKWPQLVQDIAKDQGIDISPIESPKSTFGFYLYYGGKQYCEDGRYLGNGADCSNDGLLWKTDDGDFMCTAHMLKIKEDSECEFVEVPSAAL